MRVCLNTEDLGGVVNASIFAEAIRNAYPLAKVKWGPHVPPTIEWTDEEDEEVKAEQRSLIDQGIDEIWDRLREDGAVSHVPSDLLTERPMPVSLVIALGELCAFAVRFGPWHLDDDVTDIRWDAPQWPTDEEVKRIAAVVARARLEADAWCPPRKGAENWGLWLAIKAVPFYPSFNTEA